MPRLIEMLVKRPPAHVHEIAADLARELDAQPMQFVQPVGDRFAVPCEGQLERVIDFLGGVGVGFGVVREGCGGAGVVEFDLPLALRHALFALDVDAGGDAFGGEGGSEFGDAEFALCDGTFFEVVELVGLRLSFMVVRSDGVEAGGAGFGRFDVLLAVEVVLVDVIVLELFFAVETPDAFSCAFCCGSPRAGRLDVFRPAGDGTQLPGFFEVGVESGEEGFEIIEWPSAFKKVFEVG